ncbi:thiamine phosphate synthase [Bacillus sp. FSL W7-1360]
MRDFSLYAITGEAFHPGRDIAEVMEEAICGGVDMVQLRDKTSSKQQVLEKAYALKKVTDAYGVPLIINDHIDVALAVDADGVHVGQNDLPLADVRHIVGSEKIIGVSTHALSEAIAAEKGGANYIGVGPIFPTNSKVDVFAPVTTAYIREVVQHVNIPFVAIGGIKVENVAEVVSAGAKRISVISAIAGAKDVKAATSALKAALKGARTS